MELRAGARREPNTRATTVELFDGLEADEPEPLCRRCASTCWRVNSLLAPICVAGFYYKTFMWPAAFWERVYEPLIRRAAGPRPRARRARSRQVRARHSRICDVLVIGGGPAGLAAALAAGARRRARDPLRRGFPARRPAARGARRRSTASPARAMGGGAPWPSCASLPDVRIMRAHHGVRRLRPRHLRRARARRRPSRRAAPHQPRQRCGRSSRKRAVLAAGAHRAADRLRRQRSPGRDAGLRGARPISTASPSAPGRAP